MKNGQVSTDTPILLSIIVFQIFIITCLGFLDISENYVTYQGFGSETIGFFQNIIINISYLGWGNTLIFLPLIICLSYIIAKFIRGI